MKKSIIYFMSLGIIIWLWWFWLCEWQKFGWETLEEKNPYTNNQAKLPECDSTNIWDCVSVKEEDETIILRLLKVFWLDNDTGRDHKFIDYARAIINMALWLVSFIALGMSIYTFYMMFFSENEAWIKKAKWNLIGIFIALGVLWLAWIIVSFIFRWYQSNWQERESDIISGTVAIQSNNETISNKEIYLII
jgi:hypothetical protein